MIDANKSIVPPVQELRITPKLTGSLLSFILLIGVGIFAIISAFVFSPYTLFLLVIIIPGLIFPLLYRKNGFISVTKEGIDLAGFRGTVTKHVPFNSIYKVAKAKTLHINGRNGGANSPAVIFLDANGNQIFYVMGYHFSDEDLQKLFDLFDQNDKIEFDFIPIGDIKDALNKT